jgi:YD repeat-containing protein
VPRRSDIDPTRKSRKQRCRRTSWQIVLGASAGALLAIACFAGDTAYTYDALGRLVKVVRPDSVITNYTLDAAGNRIEVQEGTPPGAPAGWTNYPAASNSTGSYTLTWTAPSSGGPVGAYQLYESASSSFGVQTLLYDGTALSFSFLNKANGTYYYRVRACSAGGLCGLYLTGAGITVTAAPPPPTNLIKTNPNQGQWRAEWCNSVGATSYKFSDLSGVQTTIANNPSLTCPPNDSAHRQFYQYNCPSGNCATNPPKWVQACVNGTNCSVKVNFP